MKPYWQSANGDAVLYCGDCLEVLRQLPERSVSLVVTSPPYEAQRTYSMDFKLIGQTWVDWMIPRVVEMCRVSAGLVFINAAGPVCKHAYSPSLEWLVTDLTRKHGLVCGPSPYAWVKSEDRDDASPNGIPGSGGKHYHRRDWEPIYAFCLPDRLPLKWSNNLAYGKEPKANSFGGEFSHRHADGQRRNAKKGLARLKQFKQARATRRSTGDYKNVERFRHAADGTVKGDHVRDICKIANAGNVLRVPVGGHKMGHPLAHETEAPFPLGIPQRFIEWFCPPGGTVLDPFIGSGTTAHAATLTGRCWIGCDIRESQCALVRRRIDDLFAAAPLFADAPRQMTLEGC